MTNTLGELPVNESILLINSMEFIAGDCGLIERDLISIHADLLKKRIEIED